TTINAFSQPGGLRLRISHAAIRRAERSVTLRYGEARTEPERPAAIGSSGPSRDVSRPITIAVPAAAILTAAARRPGPITEPTLLNRIPGRCWAIAMACSQS